MKNGKLKKMNKRSMILIIITLIIITNMNLTMYAKEKITVSENAILEQKKEAVSGNDLSIMETNEIVASGDGWTLDVNGHLVVDCVCTYSYYRRPWGTEYNSQIKSASVKLYEYENLNNLFSGCENLEMIDFMNSDFSKVKTATRVFEGCKKLKEIKGLNLANVENVKYMFYGCSSMEKIDVSGINTSKVTDMSFMFAGCSALTELDLSGFDTSNVTDMQCMFIYTSGLKVLDLSGFKTSKVTNMQGMFMGSGVENLDLSAFDTSNVEEMFWMFLGAQAKIINVSSFNTQKVESFDGMFAGCSNVEELDLGSFDMVGAREEQSWYLYDFLSQTYKLNKFVAPKNIPGQISLGSSNGAFYDEQGKFHYYPQEGINYSKTYWKIPQDEKGNVRDYIILDNGTKVKVDQVFHFGPYTPEKTETEEKIEETPAVSEEPVPEPQKQTIKVSKKASKTVVFKRKTLKKKSKSFKIGAVINNGQPHGIVSYKVTKWPKGGKKYISVSRRGVVTMKKGAKKGVYKVKITVNAVGNMLKKATKVVTIRVK